MYYFIITLTVIVSICLILIVLVQKSKGGGLSSQFSGVNSVVGVRSANSGIEKGTWILAGLLGLLAILSAFTMPKASVEAQIRTKTEAAAPVPAANQYGQNAPAAPAAPAAAPAAEQAPAAGE